MLGGLLAAVLAVLTFWAGGSAEAARDSPVLSHEPSLHADLALLPILLLGEALVVRHAFLELRSHPTKTFRIVGSSRPHDAEDALKGKKEG